MKSVILSLIAMIDGAFVGIGFMLYNLTGDFNLLFYTALCLVGGVGLSILNHKDI